MSNPYDVDEEFFGMIEANALPSDADVYKDAPSLQPLLDEVTKNIKEKYGELLLKEIVVSFTYEDPNGFTSWVTTNYNVKKD